MSKRKVHTAKFKKSVALDAIKKSLTVAELACKHQVHPSRMLMYGGVSTFVAIAMASENA